MHRFAGLVLAGLGAGCAGAPERPADPRAATLSLELGVDAAGLPTPSWRAALEDSFEAGEAARLAAERRPLGQDERAWLAVLEEAVPRVQERLAALAAPFGVEPVDALVVAGNRTGRDGFAWLPGFVGIDLQAFVRAYGPPDGDSLDRMARIVTHEYVHLLVRARDGRSPARRDTPLARALWTLYDEGLGDFHSLSERWIPAPDGAPSAAATEALGRLEPELVERLEGLARTALTEAEEERLRERIAMGRFDRKWGSLPVALWLHAEAAREGRSEVLTRFARGGPAEVLPLVRRHIRPELRPRVEALLALAGDAR